MGGKDVMEKTLEAYNDVFADIVNALLFRGEPVVAPDALTDAQPFSFYAMENQARWQERDVAKYWNRTHRIRLALFGMENQTEIDADIPFRVMSYDGAAYRAQLSEGKERYPVVTLVLYFGQRPWKKRRITDYLEVSDALKPFVHDYEANIFEIAYLTPEEIDRFHSDFRIVADYFARSRTDPDYRPTDPQKFEHTNELLRLMRVVTGDERYTDLIEAEGGVPSNMCEVLDRVEQRGMERGLAEGLAEGRASGLAEGRASGLAEGRASGLAEGRASGLAEGRASGLAEGAEQRARQIALNLRDSLAMNDPAQVAQLVAMPVETVRRWFAGA